MLRHSVGVKILYISFSYVSYVFSLFLLVLYPFVVYLSLFSFCEAVVMLFLFVDILCFVFVVAVASLCGHFVTLSDYLLSLCCRFV